MQELEVHFEDILDMFFSFDCWALHRYNGRWLSIFDAL